MIWMASQAPQVPGPAPRNDAAEDRPPAPVPVPEAQLAHGFPFLVAQFFTVPQTWTGPLLPGRVHFRLGLLPVQSDVSPNAALRQPLMLPHVLRYPFQPGLGVDPFEGEQRRQRRPAVSHQHPAISVGIHAATAVAGSDGNRKFRIGVLPCAIPGTPIFSTGASLAT